MKRNNNIQWRRFGDKLPSEGESVLVFIKRKNSYHACVVGEYGGCEQLNDGSWYEHIDTESDDLWMLIPDPSTEGKQ